MKVSIFIFGAYKGEIEVAEGSMMGLMARRKWEDLPEKITEFKYDIAVVPVNQGREDERESDNRQ